MLTRRQPTIHEQHLLRENDGLRTEIVRLRHDLTHKQGHVGRLEVLLCERSNRIDELNAKIDQLREQNKRLDAENEHLVEMVRLPGNPFGLV
jgi:hypothetical protein